MADILCNNIGIRSFVNTPVPSITYLLFDETNKSCIVIDPGSKEEIEIRTQIYDSGLSLDYILLTHEHFDHCWGVNYLKGLFPRAQVVATRLCAEWVMKPWNYFNQMYYNSDEYYQISEIDRIVENLDWKIMWNDVLIRFIYTPGHTDKSMCIDIGGSLFTGDTVLLNTKPFLKKRYGASKEDLRESISHIFNAYPTNTRVYPGHGDVFLLEEAKQYYVNYFNE